MQDNTTGFLKHFWPMLPSLPWLVAAGVVALICAWLRFDLIEPLARSAACATEPAQVVCQIRSGLIELFQAERVGWAALLVSLVALLTQSRWLSGIGLLTGSAALILYSVEPGAAAVLLASMLLLRRGSSA